MTTTKDTEMDELREKILSILCRQLSKDFAEDYADEIMALITHQIATAELALLERVREKGPKDFDSAKDLLNPDYMNGYNGSNQLWRKVIDTEIERLKGEL